MKKVLLLVFFGLLLAVPPNVLGQTGTSASGTSVTGFNTSATGTISSFGSSFTGYQTDNIISVPVNGGEIIFDKVNAGVTIYDKDGIVVDSDSYSVRASQLNQDNWEHLSTNDATPVTDSWIDPFGNIVVTYTKEDIAGKFVVEYVITGWNGKIKTTAYFTNYTLFNHKIAFTETLQLIKDVKINGQVVDLNQYVGVTFDRETLEANQDIVIEARESVYNSGLGFENLWSVSIFDDRVIALDYANVGETQTGIGETTSLDPTIILAPTNVTATQDPTTGEVTVSFDAPPTSSIASQQWGTHFAGGTTFTTTTGNPAVMSVTNNSGGITGIASGNNGSIKLTNPSSGGYFDATLGVIDQTTGQYYKIDYPFSTFVHSNFNNAQSNHGNQCTASSCVYEVEVSGTTINLKVNGSTFATATTTSSNFQGYWHIWGTGSGSFPATYDVELTGDFIEADQSATPTAYDVFSKGAGANYREHTFVNEGWDLSGTTYDSVSIGAHDAHPMGTTFSEDGTKMYVVGRSTPSVGQWDLTTAWDLSTASYTGNTVSVSSQEGSPNGVVFSNDGTKMFIIGTGNDTVYEYGLTTAWDITTASYSSNSIYIGSSENAPTALHFADNGSKLFIVGEQMKIIYQWNLTTGYDLSTASLGATSFNVSSQDTAPKGVFFNPLGTELYIIGDANETVYQYTLTTGHDLSTASYTQSYSVSSQDTQGQDVTFNTLGTKMYLTGDANNNVYQYSIAPVSTTNTFQITSGSGDVAYEIQFDGSFNSLTPTAQPVTWDSVTVDDVTINGNTATGQHTYDSHDQKVRSTQTMSPSTGGGAFEWTLANTGSNGYDRSVVGFGTDPFAGGNTSEWDSVEFGSHVGAALGSYLVYEMGTGSPSYTLTATRDNATDVFRVEMDSNGVVTYWLNGNLEYTSTYTASPNNDYYLHYAPSGIESITANYYSTLSGTTNLSTGSYNVVGDVVLTYDDDEIDATGGTENSWNIPALLGTVTTATHTFPPTNPVTWDSSTNYNMAISTNTVTGTNTNSGYNNAIQSTQSFNPNSNGGEIEFTIGGTQDATNYNVIGFSNAPMTSANPSIDYSFNYYSASGGWLLYEHGSQVSSVQSGNGSETVKITMDSSGVVKYYISNNLVYTSLQTASGDYYAQVKARGTASATANYIDPNQTFQITSGSGNVDYTIQPSSSFNGLSPTGWDLTNAVYDNKSFQVSSQELFPSEVVFKSDGTSMYIIGYNSDSVYQYTLSTAWDVSTASYSNNSFYIGSQSPTPLTLTFSEDGTKMYVIGNVNKTVYQYTLSTAWDVSTASYSNNSFYVNSYDTSPTSIHFKTDGTKMYVAGDGGSNKVWEFDLSSAWDVSTASNVGSSPDISSQVSSISSVTFSADGTKMLVSAQSNNTVYQYSLSSAWDVSTASYDNLSVVSQSTTTRGIDFSSDGMKLYILGDGNDTVYQYDTPNTLTGTTNLSTGSYNVSGDVSLSYDDSLITATGGNESVSTTHSISVFDGLGSSVDGTNNGATTGVTGKVGDAWSFDGSNDTVTIPSNNSIPMSTEPFTYNIWVNPDNFNGYNVYYSLGTGALDQAFYITNDGSLNNGNIEVHRYGGVIVDSGSSAITVNTWTMLTVTYDGTTAKLFFDGVEVGSNAYTINTTNNGVTIGDAPHGGHIFEGLLDEFTMYNDVLTTTELSSLYNSGNGTTTPPTSGLLAYYDFEDTGNTLTNQALTHDTYSEIPVAGIAEEYTVTASGLGENIVPVVWQNASGGISINGNTITKSGNSWANGVQGTTTFTSSQGAELVFNVGSNTQHSMVGFGKDPFVADSSDIQYVMYPASNGTICFYENNVHLSSLCNTFTYSASDDLKVKMDSNGVVTYWKNNTLLYTSTLQASGTYYVQAALYSSGVTVSANLIEYPEITSSPSTPATINTFNVPSQVNNVTAVDGMPIGITWSTGQAGSPVSNPVPYPDSLGSSADGTNNGATTGVTGKIGNAWSFDGSNDYVNLGADTLLGSNWSFGMWLKGASSGQGDNYWNFAGKGGADQSEVFNIYTPQGGGISYEVESAGYGVIPTSSLNDGQWHYLVMTYDGTDMRAYVDNTLEDTHPTVAGDSTAQARDLLIGTLDRSGAFSSKWFAGSIDEMTIYDTTLGTSEISALYNSGSGDSTPDTSGLLAHYNFEQTGTTLTNIISQNVTVNSPPVISYDVIRDGTVLATVSAPTTQYTDSNVVAGQTYDYQIIATAVVGSGVESLTSTAQTVSQANAPTNFTVNPNSSAQLVLDWTASSDLGGGSLLSMQIDRSIDGGSTWASLVQTTNTSPPYTDTTVVAGNTYHYRIASVNEYGTGVYSSTVGAIAGVPANPPSSVVATISDPDNNPDDVDITFSEPSSWGTGTPVSYGIYESLTGTGGWTQVANPTYVAGSFNTTITISNVLPNTDYHYMVRAISTHGSSNDSNTSMVTTPDVPTSDSSVTLSIDNPNPNPLDITVSFVAPSSDGGSAVVSYDLHSSPDDITYTQIATGVTADQTVTVSSAGTWYFKSLSTNNMGSSSLGSAVSIATPSVPTAPQNASSTIADVDLAPYDVTVTWETPSSTGGSDLTQYNVYRKQGSGSYSLLTTTTGLSINDTLPTLLSTNFNYKIHAVNNIGESTAFVDTTITTFDVPQAPTLSVTTGTTVLSWNTPTSDGTVTNYKIYRDGSLVTTVGSVNTHTDFTTIVFGNSYDYKVVAVSSLGDSADSNTVTTTPETEITGMVALGITGTGAVIDWEEPAYYQGQITSYNVYYGNSGIPATSAGTTTNTYNNFAPQLDYDTTYVFGVSINSPLGNSGLSNIVTITTSVDGSIVAYDPNTGTIDWFDIDSVSEQTVNVIKFQRETQTINGTATDTLQVGYPSWWDEMTCDVDYKFAQKTEQYVEGDDMTAQINSADANQQVIGFAFQDIDNEVIEVECAPQVSQQDDEVSAKYIMTQQTLGNLQADGTYSSGIPSIPLVAQIQGFQTGDYGTDGEFSGLDIVGLFVILISMVGFNRLNPIVGVLLSASLVFALSFFGIISLPTVLVGVVALVIFLAWGIQRNR